MRVLPIHVVPIFLGQGAGGALGAQLCYFDVFYTEPPIVGFHVSCDAALTQQILGFTVDTDCVEPEAVAGFCVSDNTPDNGIIGFTADVPPCEETDTVAGFYACEQQESEAVVGFDAQRSEYYGGVVGFILGVEE
jgi:hypothetical protein